MNLFPTSFARKLGRQLEITLRPTSATASTVTPDNWHEEFIIHLASVLRPKVYVELGLYQCALFNRIAPLTEKSIGVDTEVSAGTFMDTTSGKGEFFHGTTNALAAELTKRGVSIDLLFIDANHSKESVREDFTNFFPLVRDQGMIILHDAYPKDAEFTAPGYCGDGYLAIAELARHTDTYEMVTIPRHPGVALCRKRSKQLPWL